VWSGLPDLGADDFPGGVYPEEVRPDVGVGSLGRGVRGGGCFRAAGLADRDLPLELGGAGPLELVVDQDPLTRLIELTGRRAPLADEITGRSPDPGLNCLRWHPAAYAAAECEESEGEDHADGAH
jgi:hypothetical protein